MSSPISSPLSSFNTFTLPIINKIFTENGLCIYTIKGIPMGSFLNINLNIETGPNSKIDIIKPCGKINTFSGKINTNLKLGKDDENKVSFKHGDTVTFVVKVSQDDIVTINNLSVKEINNFNNIDIKKFINIFLVVFFIIFILM